MSQVTSEMPSYGATRSTGQKTPGKIRKFRSVSNTDQLEICRSPYSQKEKSVHKSISAPMLSGMLDRKLKAYVADKRKLFRNGTRTYDKLQSEWFSFSESMGFDIHDVQVVDVEAQVSLNRVATSYPPVFVPLFHYFSGLVSIAGGSPIKCPVLFFRKRLSRINWKKDRSLSISSTFQRKPRKVNAVWQQRQKTRTETDSKMFIRMITIE